MASSARRVVHLGFAEHTDNRRRLLSRFFPLGKVGGRPAWLSFTPLPSPENLLCQKCDKPMVFLLQIYAPIEHADETDTQCFHRSLFVFLCRNADCSAPNQASNIRSFRCQLARANEFYPFDPIVFDDSTTDKETSTCVAVSFSHICPVCGCQATKKCAKCENMWYCCREHQALHWRSSHKVNCGQGENQQQQVDVDDFASSVLFPEYEIVMEVDESNDSKPPVDDEDDDDDDEPDERDEADRMKDYRAFLADRLNERDGVTVTPDEVDDFELAQKADVEFKRFRTVVGRNPEQILRYDRGGEPLWATGGALTQVPACPLCAQPRQFEFQIMPHLLTLLNLDEQLAGPSIDWATIAIYTCKCPIPDNGYAPEFVLKQDFA